LIEQVLAGKTESFADLVGKYQDRLYNTLVHVTGSTHEAEEVTQDAMLQAYTKLATFRGASSFYTWLYRIAFNLSVSRRRKARPRLSLNELQVTAGIDPTDETEGPDDAAERSERAEHLLAAMDRIGEEHRVVLVLREMEDCDYETISQMLEIPVGTVRSRLHRARTQLRNQLKQMIGEHE
jgi:RNA polymerase sigma-70 factor (ECF subfamily)